MSQDQKVAASPDLEKRQKQVISPWLPVALLAVTSAALIVPLRLLRRQRALKSQAAAVKSQTQTHTRLGNNPAGASAAPNAAPRRTLATAAPPPRRRAVSATPPPPPPSPTIPSSLSSSSPSSSSSSSVPHLASASSVPKPDFNAYLHGAKAFGIATGIVLMVAGSGGWWAYRKTDDPRALAARLRAGFEGYMPTSLRRALASNPDADATADVEEEEARGWTLDAAKTRLADAYARDGLASWFETALRETELEAAQERLRDGARG